MTTLHQSKGKIVDNDIYSLLDITPEPRLESDEIIQRSVYLLLNEAAMCLDEGEIPA